MANKRRKLSPKTVLKLPDLEQSRSAVLNTLTSHSSQRSYDHAIREFIDWYCSEPRLAFNKTVVTRYGSGVWTADIQEDFDYRNNVIANGNYAWTYQGGASTQADAGDRGGRQGGPPAPAAPKELKRYKVIDSYFAANRRVAGSGTGARLEYQYMDPSFLELVGTKVTDQPVAIERDQTKRNCPNPVAGSEAAKIGAGLLMRPGA